MVTIQKQEQFKNIVKLKLTKSEQNWSERRIGILSEENAQDNFAAFFSLASRFVSDEISKWDTQELKNLEIIYPGFGKSSWTSQDLVRVLFMISLKTDKNKLVIENFFEIAEMKELISLYKGLFMLENAKDFHKNVEEGLRTNMVNVFDSIVIGNPFLKTYLEERSWNQAVLKAVFLDRPLYKIQYIDQGKSKKLANILQDYVKEKWTADRCVSPEIWRLIKGYLREDIKKILLKKTFIGVEREAISILLNERKMNDSKFWDKIGKSK